MNRQERLADAMTGIVVWVCVLFFAFAAGVWCAEQKAEAETKERPRPVTVTVMEAKVEAGPLPDDGGFAGPDPMVEDGYLRDDLPLDYETQKLLYGACLEFQVDYDLALAVIDQETNFRNMTGDGGESAGYMQIQRKWWGGLMDEIGTEDLNQPEDNFRTGCAILRQLLDKYGNTEDALTAYNSGRPGSSRYSRSVLEKLNG